MLNTKGVLHFYTKFLYLFVALKLILWSFFIPPLYSQQINIDVGNLSYDANRRIQVLDFGEFEAEEVAIKSIFFKPDSKLIIEGISVTGDFTLLSPGSDENPKRNASIEVAFDSKCKQGEYLGEVEIITNGPMKRRVIGLKSFVHERSSSFHLSDDTLFLEESNTSASGFTIVNDGNSTLFIQSIETQNSDVLFVIDESELNPATSNGVNIKILEGVWPSGQLFVDVVLRTCTENIELHEKQLTIKFLQ